MKSIEKVITLFVILLCLSVTLFNISHIYLTFIPVGKGSEAWIEDYSIEELDDNYRFNWSIVVNNLYDYDKPFTYFVEFFENGNSFKYFIDSFILKASEISHILESIILSNIPEMVKIKIENGSEDINLNV